MRSSRVGSRAACALALTTAVVVAGGETSAHRLDEYLQAARIAIDPDAVHVELDLTPGIALAEVVIAGIDRNRDGSMSADEQRTYANLVLGALEVRVDGQALRVEPAKGLPLISGRSIAPGWLLRPFGALRAPRTAMRLSPTASQREQNCRFGPHSGPSDVMFPDNEAMRRGEGTIRLQSVTRLRRQSIGAHRLSFRNGYHPDGSVYLANALVPRSDQVAVTAQRRDGGQSELIIDYKVRGAPATCTRAFLLGSIAVAAVLFALLKRPPKQTFSA